MRAFRKTALAASLLLIAVLVPTGAWYFTGSREAAMRASELESEALAEAQGVVDYDAERLGLRLEALRLSESARPFFHYQNLYHDPRSAAQCLSVTPSPLASGVPDPLVWAHFQIDDHGNVTLPTVNETFPELSADEGFAMLCSFLAELEEGVVMTPNPDQTSDSPSWRTTEDCLRDRRARQIRDNGGVDLAPGR
jgi:hypothetical protein